MDGEAATAERLTAHAAFDLPRRVVAEALGTALLLAIVVGSGIMGERLAGGNVAIALLANSLATGAGLVVLIAVFRPVSGAHFNPAVTMALAIGDKTPLGVCAAYVGAQLAGAVAGVWSAHLMFAEPLFQISEKIRSGFGQAFSEGVATFGIVLVILCAARWRAENTPMLVGLYIAAAYWFTASTSFANPVVTFARALTQTFAGIAPVSVPAFIIAQLLGALCAVGACRWLLRRASS